MLLPRSRGKNSPSIVKDPGRGLLSFQRQTSITTKIMNRMTEKLGSSVKAHFDSHTGMMGLCILLMAVVFLGFAGGRTDSGGPGTFGLLLLLAGCLAMHFVTHRFMGQGRTR